MAQKIATSSAPEFPLAIGVAGAATVLAAVGRGAEARLALQAGAVVIALVAAARCWQRGSRYDHRGGTAWRVFAIGVATWAVGRVLVAVAPITDPLVRLAGLAALCPFPILTAVGLAMYLRQSFDRIPVVRVGLDGVILSVSLLVLYSTLLFTPWNPPQGGFSAATGFEAALILGDLAVATLIVFVFTRAGLDNPTVTWLGLGLAALILGDLAAVYETGAGGREARWVAGYAHLFAFALAAVAASAPDSRTISPNRRVRPSPIGLVLPYLPFVLAMAASLTPAGASLTHRGITTGLAALVVLRQFLTLRDNEHLLQRVQDHVRELDRRTEALADANSRLREHDRQRGEFVTLITHELRTPLTNILGRVEELTDNAMSDVPPMARLHLGAIARNSHRLSSLMSDLQSASGIGGVDLQVNGVGVDLKRLAGDCVAAVSRREAARSDLVLTACAAPVYTVGVHEELRKALEELMWNAVKFSPPGTKARVHVDTSGGRAVVTVSNSGPGITADEQERLFTPFFRASAATDQAIEGRGLGLVITKGIAERHRGELLITSVPGQTTTVRMTLPAAPRDESDEVMRPAGGRVGGDQVGEGATWAGDGWGGTVP